MIEADYIHQFFFCYYTYICFTVFIVGSALRYDRDQYTWKADSSQLLRKKGMLIGNNLFHIGILFLFCGHLVGLLTPEAVYHKFIDSGSKQMFAMVSGGIFGVFCFIGMTMLLIRRLFDSRIRINSRPSDIMILLILYTQLILGLATIPLSAQHMDGSSMVELASWAQHIVTFQDGAANFIMDKPLIFKMHLVLGTTIFLIFPFTRMVHVFSGVVVPIQYVWRCGYQIVRKRES
ncbi:respiratory nitrate reductase subunit gamma [Anaplasmataceae bacterium AB001_6]|nr:respiratory nitrate reductase subunit gamma [Anaplasmataceae bacterium AB001_6]